MIDRRKFSVIAAVGVAVPSLVLAAPQRRSDLHITALRWSTDAGITFGTGPVVEGSDVWFEAVVRNRGQAAWPSGTVLRVDFSVRGQVVTWSNTRTSGLARGTSVTLRANTGVGGDKFWIAEQPGSAAVLARTDPQNLILESLETNNTRSATMTIEMSAEPPPIANDDEASTSINTPVEIDVLANDEAPPGKTLQISSVQSPTPNGGSVIITTGQKLRYVPPSGFRGIDIFSYEVTAT